MAFNPSLRTLTTLVLSALCSCASASAADRPQAPAATTDAIRKMTVMVPMRDGVGLATDIYQPEPLNGPLPVIFTRGPYGKRGVEPLSKVACPKGYIFVSQDMRGRHDSEGNDSVAFHNDGWGKRRDGQDSLDWIAKQPWCNGKIGTHGGSALGITQTMMAPARRRAQGPVGVLRVLRHVFAVRLPRRGLAEIARRVLARRQRVRSKEPRYVPAAPKIR